MRRSANRCGIFALAVVAVAALAILAAPAMVEAQTARPGRARPPVAKTADAGDLEALAKFHARLLQMETDTSGKDTSGKIGRAHV